MSMTGGSARILNGARTDGRAWKSLMGTAFGREPSDSRGYPVSDPEFALAESDFLFRPQRLNVLVSRAEGKLVLLLGRRLLKVLPPDEGSGLI